MTAQLDNNTPVECAKVTIILADVEFRIQLNNQGEVVITKQQFGDGEGAIMVKPSVSNQIRLL